MDLREDIDVKQATIAEVLKLLDNPIVYVKLEKEIFLLNIFRILVKYYNTSSDYILELTDEIKPYNKK